MAKLKPGIFGHPTGRIGNTVFYTLNGQAVCRSIGEQKNTPSTKQKANRKVMELMMGLLKPLQGFIKHGFEHQAKGTVCNPFNLATSYNINNALIGDHPNLNIDYAKVKLSSGTLPLAKDLQISRTADGVKVSWDSTHAWKGDQYDDLVMVALFHPKDKKASLFLNAGKREQGECLLKILEEEWRDEPMEAYLCFKSADGKTISDSVYLGNLNGSYEELVKEEINKEYTKLKIEVDEAKVRLEKQAAYCEKTGFKKKILKNLNTEYEVLKERLENLPGELKTLI